MMMLMGEDDLSEEEIDLMALEENPSNQLLAAIDDIELAFYYN